MKNILFVALGGSIGSVLRYLVNILSDKVSSTWIFSSTLIVNLIGSFFIGFLLSIIKAYNFSENIKFLLIVGLLGSFTTFSTFTFEAYKLLKNSQYLNLALYIFSSLVLGITLVFIGFYLSNLVTNLFK